jgi:hypothetical protein
MDTRRLSLDAGNPSGSSSRSVSTAVFAFLYQRPVHIVRGLTHRKVPHMKNSTKSLALAAAVAGLLGGTSVRMNAQPTSATTSVSAGVLLAQTTPDPTKHSCKGKNDCKGQGGGKHPGKNSCKGKGDCATDGSKGPKA